MYKLYIVDDDPLVIKGLSVNVPWNEHDISIAGTASNGVKALELMEHNPPDIVITDVKMPLMDGIELTKHIHERFPKVRVILLSAHDEFTYVRDALHLHVVDYLLKPCENQTVLDTVIKAIERIKQESSMERNMKEHLPAMRQVFLSRIVTGYYKNEDILQSHIEFLGLKITPGFFICATVQFDDINYYGNSAAQRELLKFAVRNISEELSAERKLNAHIFDSGEDSLGIILCSDDLDETQSFVSSVTDYLLYIHDMVEIHINTTITIGYGNCHKGFSGIYRSYGEACSAIKYSYITGTNHVYSPDDAIASNENSLIEYSSYIEELLDKVRVCFIEDAYAVIDRLYAEIKKRPQMSADYLKMLYTEIVVSLIRDASKSYGSDLDFESLNLFDYYKQINAFFTLDNMVHHIKKLVTALSEICADERLSPRTKLVQQAMEYIMDNYSDDTLSLNQVARAVNVTPVYLSAIFKKEKDINFLSFLVEVRMKKAMELIRQQDLKFYEVAELVGYKNPNYFGMCFKKFTGYSPSQFWKGEIK